MDDLTKRTIEKKCKEEIQNIKNDGHSEEYIQGYLSAYKKGFEAGNEYGLKRLEKKIRSL